MLNETLQAWTQFSPWLDELLNLAPAERTQRLAELARDDAVLADSLQRWLTRLERLDAEGFMTAPAVPAPAQAPARSAGAAYGQVIGAYTLERLLGEGGMGSVWLARRSDGRFQGQVAIKFLRGGQHHPALARRFAREAQLLGRLAHPHIARLLDAGLNEADAQPYLVLEYVQGRPIDQWCDSGKLDLSARLRLLLDAMDAVAHAHERLVLHRDLKPSNILVDEQGRVKLLDFGIARLQASRSDDADADANPDVNVDADITRQSGNAFTPRWAAPEQLDGGELTAACDVYALGLLMHLLLTGLPAQGEDASGLGVAQLRARQQQGLPLASAALQDPATRAPSGPVDASDVKRRKARVQALRGDLDTIIAKALKAVPAERYRSAAAMADDLRRHLRHEPILARPDSAAYRASRFVRRHWLAVASSGAVAAALLVGGGVALVQAREARAERAQAESLLQYMLGELRGKLEPLGQLPLLDGVGRRALAYYDAKPLATLDDDGLTRRTQALHLLCVIAQQQGRLDDAARMAQQAHDGSQLLLQRRPHEVRALRLHAASESQRALAAEAQGRSEQAQESYLARISLLQQALALQPADAALRLDLSDAQGELASLYAQTNRPDLALPLFDLERDELARQAPGKPELWHVLANNRAWVANTLFGLDRFEAALQAVQAHVQAIHNVPDLDANTEARWYGALGYNRLSGILQALGRTDEAQAASRRAVQDMEALAAHDRSNTSWQIQAAYHRQQLASVLAESGRLVEARQEVDASRAALDAIRPGADPAMERLSSVGLRVLATQRELNPTAPALLPQLHVRIAEEVRREPRVEKRGSELGADLALARLQAGQGLAAQGRDSEAGALWQTALQELDSQFGSPARRLSAGTRGTRARLLLALGRIEEARAEAATLRQLGWLRPLPAALQ